MNAHHALTCPEFEAVLSLLETLPPDQAAEALSVARERLLRLPASRRGQPIDADTFGALLQTPGWPLVGHLTIFDLTGEGIANFLSHPGLSGIELVTLGYEDCGKSPDTRFTRALVESSLHNVRELRLDSVQFSDKDRALFWASPFAARLERIVNVAYRGEALPHPLRAAEIELPGEWNPVANQDGLLRLLAPEATPHLQRLTIREHYAAGAAPDLLRLLTAHRAAFERIKEVSIAVYGMTYETRPLFATAKLPRTVKVLWRLNQTHGRIFSNDDEIDTVYSPDEGDDVSKIDEVTHYPYLMVELKDADQLSRGLRELKLLAPRSASPAKIQKAIDRFPALERLGLVYPFSEAQLPAFLKVNGRLSRVELYLTMRPGHDITDYISQHKKGYVSDATPEFLLRTALASKNLTLFSDVLDVYRTPSGFEQLTLKKSTAVRALAKLDPGVPIESLTLDTKLTGAGAKALVRSGVLSRVYRLTLMSGLSDEAATALAKCPHVRGVRGLSLLSFVGVTPAAFAELVGSPYLTSVLDLCIWAIPDGGYAQLSQAPLLPGLVSLELNDREQSEAIPAPGRFRRLRRLGGFLSLNVLRDEQLARLWLTAGPAVPLAVGLQKFLGHVASRARRYPS
jgi:hypothetical protein